MLPFIFFFKFISSYLKADFPEKRRVSEEDCPSASSLPTWLQSLELFQPHNRSQGVPSGLPMMHVPQTRSSCTALPRYKQETGSSRVVRTQAFYEMLALQHKDWHVMQPLSLLFSTDLPSDFPKNCLSHLPHKQKKHNYFKPFTP